MSGNFTQIHHPRDAIVGLQAILLVSSQGPSNSVCQHLLPLPAAMCRLHTKGLFATPVGSHFLFPHVPPFSLPLSVLGPPSLPSWLWSHLSASTPLPGFHSLPFPQYSPSYQVCCISRLLRGTPWHGPNMLPACHPHYIS